MKIRFSESVELLIENLAFGGSGIGRLIMPDGRKMAVFVEGAIPGDRVKVRIGGKKRNYLIGYIEEFISNAENRIKPRCPFFSDSSSACKLMCGGCSLQFLSYEDQLKIKGQHVRDSISRIGGFDSSLVRPIIGCEDTWFYRNKMEFSFSRTKEGELSFGLHMRRRHHELVQLDQCFLMEPYIGNLVSHLRALFFEADRAKIFPEEMLLKSLVIRQSKTNGQVMFNLIADNAGPKFLAGKFLEQFKNILIDFFKALSAPSANVELASIYFTNVTNKKGQSKKTDEILLFGKTVITETMRRPDGTELHFDISPQSFFQPNSRQAEILYSQALQAAALTGTETVYDLYCGAGTIGIFLANHAKKVYGIEIIRAAVENARQNASANQIKNVEFFCGDTEKELAKISSVEKPDLVIVDPPRNGLEPQALEKVINLDAPKIVYISCNPTTQARDLQKMAKSGYILKQIQPVDMFPQTYHIESVALLQKQR